MAGHFPLHLCKNFKKIPCSEINRKFQFLDSIFNPVLRPDPLPEARTCATGAPCFVQVTGTGLGSRNRLAVVPGPLVTSRAAEWKLLARQTVTSHRRRADVVGTAADLVEI